MNVEEHRTDVSADKTDFGVWEDMYY